MSQTSIRVEFAPGAGASDFRLEYEADDNILPSKVDGALEALANQLQQEGQAFIARNPSLWGIYPTAEIAAAVKEAARDPKVRAGEQLYAQDEAAWPVRRIRMYPPGPALVTCSYGSVVPKHVVTTTISETLVFTGSAEAALDYIGHGASVLAEGRAYDTSGSLVTDLTLSYRDGKIMAPRPIYAIINVSYLATYQVAELTAPPTGGDFSVLVAAFRGGEHTSVLVPFQVLEFDPVEEKVEVGTGGYTFGAGWRPFQESLERALEGDWAEKSRRMSSVNIQGVVIDRIDEVTFSRGRGASTVTLRFNNR
jgi:hypothetical protein